MTIAAAIAALKDSLPGVMGMMTSPSHRLRSSALSPLPSLPMATTASLSSAVRISAARSESAGAVKLHAAAVDIFRGGGYIHADDVFPENGAHCGAAVLGL